MTEWEEFLKEGGQYLDTARKGMSRRQVFNNEILFNLLAMSMEKNFMSLLRFHHKMAEHHTLAALAREAGEAVGEVPAVVGQLALMDGVQEICHLEAYTRRGPTDGDVTQMLALGEDVRTFVLRHLYGEAVPGGAGA